MNHCIHETRLIVPLSETLQSIMKLYWMHHYPVILCVVVYRDASLPFSSGDPLVFSSSNGKFENLPD